MATKHGLGRGLGALIEGMPSAGKRGESSAPIRVPVAQIQTNPFQPRRRFSPEALQDLVASVRERGVIQPLLVRRKGDGYELIAGERRLRAAKEAGIADVPVIVMEAADGESLELALIENLQREDLNAMEEAEGYRALAEKFGLTQEQIAQRVGKARASVANAMRLLGLPAEVQKMIAEGRLSAGHAKALLGLDIPAEQQILAQRAVKEGMSVRELERIVERTTRKAGRRRSSGASDIPASHLSYLADMLHRHFGTSVRINPCRTLAGGRKAKGVLEIDFFSNDDLTRILQLAGLKDIQ